MPVTCFHATVVSNARRGVPRLGDVFEQTDRVRRVSNDFQTIQADTPLSRKERHPFDRFYNFFSRSAWTVHDLAHQVAVAIVVRLNPRGLLYLVVDDTLLHKRGKHVYGLGWFRDAVASTAKRVATAGGNHWVVIGLAIGIPGTNKIYCLPNPQQAMKKADRNRSGWGPWVWQTVQATAYGVTRRLQVVSFQAV